MHRDRIVRTTTALVAAGACVAISITGCADLEKSDFARSTGMFSASQEGTGFQIIGAVVVLAKYHASKHQIAVAEEQARKATLRFVKPHYEQRRATAQSASRKKIADTEKDYDRRIARSQSSGTPAQPPATGTPPAAELEAEKAKALEKIRADAAAELAALDREWRSLAGMPSRGLKMEKAPETPAGGVPLASTRDREALIASASAHLPKYIAVAVPRQGIAAEQGGESTIMLWDSRKQRLVASEVLVLNRTPRDGVNLRVDGVTAQFAGSE
jgi:hypothetical protein